MVFPILLCHLRKRPSSSSLSLPLPPLTPPSRPTSRRTWPRERSLLTRPPVFTHLPVSFLITMQCARMHLSQEVASASVHTLFFSNPNVFLQRTTRDNINLKQVHCWTWALQCWPMVELIRKLRHCRARALQCCHVRHSQSWTFHRSGN